MSDDQEVETSKTRSLCAICGDASTGLHYGVNSCEGCKCFFRRSAKGAKIRPCVSSGRCDITFQTRGHCQCCRYQKCLNMGMVLDESPDKRRRSGIKLKKKKKKSKINEDSDEFDDIENEAGDGETEPEAEKLCAVCTQPAKGLNQGIYSCTGCACFFRRSVNKNMEYKCRQDEFCDLTSGSRKRCSHCRYEKCLQVGMKPEAVGSTLHSASLRSDSVNESSDVKLDSLDMTCESDFEEIEENGVAVEESPEKEDESPPKIKMNFPSPKKLQVATPQQPSPAPKVQTPKSTQSQTPKSTQGSPEVEIQPCVVCGDPSYKKRYNVYCCHACASFFKRSLALDVKYECNNDESCKLLTKKKGGKCRHCRYVKCIKNGMSRASRRAKDKTTIKVPSKTGKADDVSEEEVVEESDEGEVSMEVNADTAPTLGTSEWAAVCQQWAVKNIAVWQSGSPASVNGGTVSANHKVCVICGDKSSNRCFNVLSCRSCNKFFHQTSMSDKILSCINGEETCDITAETRDTCAFCRLQKCLEAGMEITGHYVDESEEEQEEIKVEKTEDTKNIEIKKEPQTDSRPDKTPVKPEPVPLMTTPKTKTITPKATPKSTPKSGTPKENKKATEPTPCAVCGESEAHWHYGAQVCNGCYCFFKRSMMKDMGYECSKDEVACSLASTNRCRYCRLQKCHQVGMQYITRAFRTLADVQNDLRRGTPPKSAKKKKRRTRAAQDDDGDTDLIDEAYRNIVTAKRRRRSQSPAAEDMETSETVCSVCGGQAAGKHYGALVCTLCKEFFESSILAKTKHICSKDGECEITAGETHCLHCKLKKCVSVGMLYEHDGDDAHSNDGSEEGEYTVLFIKKKSDVGPEDTCAVCGDKPCTYCYSIVCCNSCQSFIEEARELLTENPEPFHCVNSQHRGKCDMTPQDRTCSYCRLNKAQQQGLDLIDGDIDGSESHDGYVTVGYSKGMTGLEDVDYDNYQNESLVMEDDQEDENPKVDNDRVNSHNDKKGQNEIEISHDSGVAIDTQQWGSDALEQLQLLQKAMINLQGASNEKNENKGTRSSQKARVNDQSDSAILSDAS